MSGRDRLADYQGHQSPRPETGNNNNSNNSQEYRNDIIVITISWHSHNQQNQYGQNYHQQGQYNQDYQQYGSGDQHTQNDQYDQSGQYSQEHYIQGGQYNQQEHYGHDGQYNQQEHYGHDGQYAQHGQYGQGGQYAQHDQYGQGGYQGGQYDQHQQYAQNDSYSHQGPYDQQMQYSQQGQYEQQQQQFAQQQQTQYQAQGDSPTRIEMKTVPVTATDDMTIFFTEVTSIQDDISKLEQNITKIEDLREASLNTVSTEEQALISSRQLESITEDTSQLSNRIKKRVKDIELANLRLGTSPNIQIRRTQAATLKDKFVTTLRRYQSAESEARKKYQVRMERQYKIVNPTATQEEVEQALESDNQQIFAQSVMQSTRYGEANRALIEVQSRHNDIKKIEKTILELHQLFMDMETLVTDQAVVMDAVEQDVVRVDGHLEQGNAQVDNAITNARSARKKKWICLLISIVIVIIIVIIVLAATGVF
ncbi:Plasma membrane t-SNARE, secretory vesicle fusion [Entomortierella beljakovae]|nr:Plasma membrane t-SNARE, secretory vesicle fusion [Entomortierella beljakovae]